ncbi:hypothetical protein M8C21_015181, partial [Ambrosia artemisiifolia]
MKMGLVLIDGSSKKLLLVAKTKTGELNYLICWMQRDLTGNREMFGCILMEFNVCGRFDHSSWGTFDVRIQLGKGSADEQPGNRTVEQISSKPLQKTEAPKLDNRPAAPKLDSRSAAGADPGSRQQTKTKTELRDAVETFGAMAKTEKIAFILE